MFRFMLLSLSRIVIFVCFLSFGFVVSMYGTIYFFAQNRLHHLVGQDLFVLMEIINIFNLKGPVSYF